ncbi:MAG: 2-oxo acid dehydrogenase subunit E2, partial [Euzebyaceae bacterium]|nr:2-oxo acid dehydrogenase subunit E2 [Euzebyaceae bacterium]
MPDLGEGLTEAEIVTWLVAVGDVIELNQAVAEVETAKAVVEVPSPFAGRVTALHGDVGAEVEVGTPLVTIDIDAAAPADAPSRQAGEVAANAGVTDAVPSAEPAVDDAGSGNVLVGYGTTGART